MDTMSEYEPGLGKGSPVPPEIRGWNWGAFLLNWIWGIGNNTFIALLMFVPLVNIVMLFVLGAKGNEWAWRNKMWRSVAEFKRTQRNWGIAGALILFVGFPMLFVSINGMLKGDAYELSLTAIRSSHAVSEYLGTPIKPGYFVTGQVKTSGTVGAAAIEYSVSGPKGEAEAYVWARKDGPQWVLKRVVVYDEKSQRKIQVTPASARQTDL
jgi:hypothetical protein